TADPGPKVGESHDDALPSPDHQAAPKVDSQPHRVRAKGHLELAPPHAVAASTLPPVQRSPEQVDLGLAERARRDDTARPGPDLNPAVLGELLHDGGHRLAAPAEALRQGRDLDQAAVELPEAGGREPGVPDEGHGERPDDGGAGREAWLAPPGA